MVKKNKIEKAIQVLNFGIFPGYMVFCYNHTHKEILDYFNKKGAETWYYGIKGDGKLVDDGNWLAMAREVMHNKTGKVQKLFYIVIPEKFTFSDYDYVRLAHEVTHICQFYLPDVLNRNKEHEAEAYLHSHIMTQCLNVIRGKK